MKGLNSPITPQQKIYTAGLESARKDIEQALGVLQSCFKVMEPPIVCHSLRKMGAIVQCSLIMHNMGVSNQVMGGYDTFASINGDNDYDINEQKCDE